MKRNLLAPLSALFIISFLIYRWVISLPPILIDDNLPITINQGEEIFWGKGTCHACHRIGERGYALRGPNLGDGKEGQNLPIRAARLAEELSLPNGLDYIIQSVAVPGAFIAPGFNNEMPEPFKPPISLSPSEMKSVILYLANLNGDSTNLTIDLPGTIMAYYGEPQNAEFKITGDSEAGRKLFFDLDGPAACAACHVARNTEGEKQGETIGPDLSAIGSFRTPEYILQKTINPDSNIVSGYETGLVKLKSGQIAAGILITQTSESISIKEADGKELIFRQSEVSQIIFQKNSIMPGNYNDLLTADQLFDITTFLWGQVDSESNVLFEK